MNAEKVRELMACRRRLQLERRSVIEGLRAPYRLRATERLWSDLRGLCEQLASLDDSLASVGYQPGFAAGLRLVVNRAEGDSGDTVLTGRADEAA